MENNDSTHEHYRYKIVSYCRHEYSLDNSGKCFYIVNFKPVLRLRFQDFEELELRVKDGVENTIIIEKDIINWLHNNASEAYQKTVNWKELLMENDKKLIADFINTVEFKSKRKTKQYHFNKNKNGRIS